MTTEVGILVLYILLQSRLLRCLSCVTVALEVCVRIRVYEYDVLDEGITLSKHIGGNSNRYIPDI